MYDDSQLNLPTGSSKNVLVHFMPLLASQKDNQKFQLFSRYDISI